MVHPMAGRFRLQGTPRKRRAPEAERLVGLFLNFLAFLAVRLLFLFLSVVSAVQMLYRFFFVSLVVQLCSGAT